MHPLALADAVAGDIAFDDAIAEAIERGIGHSGRQTSVPVDGTMRSAQEGARPVIAFDDAFRELLADYADLQAEHQRLSTSPHDHASHEAHSLRLDEHFRRVQVALEQLRQNF